MNKKGKVFEFLAYEEGEERNWYLDLSSMTLSQLLKLKKDLLCPVEIIEDLIFSKIPGPHAPRPRGKRLNEPYNFEKYPDNNGRRLRKRESKGKILTNK